MGSGKKIAVRTFRELMLCKYSSLQPPRVTCSVQPYPLLVLLLYEQSRSFLSSTLHALNNNLNLRHMFFGQYLLAWNWVLAVCLNGDSICNSYPRTAQLS
jgi:hypothetical protein